MVSPHVEDPAAKNGNTRPSRRASAPAPSSSSPGGRLQTNLVEPIGPGRCRVLFRYFFADPEAPRVAADIAFCERTQAEDAAICAHVERGLASGGDERGRLSVEEEAAVHHFQDRLRRVYRGEG